MGNLIKILDDWKTYILVITLILCAVLNSYDRIDEKTFQTASVTLIGLISASITQKQNKIEQIAKNSANEISKTKQLMLSADETNVRAYEQIIERINYDKQKEKIKGV